MRSESAAEQACVEPADASASVVADDLVKTYRLGESLRLEATIRALVRRPRALERFEALRGVSFETYPGECFGIVGTNGSGKSTVLQILSGITLPTSGEMRVRGTVLPLLAVGAGFHIELTGRENAFLYGTILGLKRDLINSKLERIAQFAELERHFDTPIKRYSTGMQSRLCFAIAMLFPAAIYCFDEVLAVVDGEFKDRCLQEIRTLADAQSTVFFISHDLDQLRTICDRVMWLEHGVLREVGPPDDLLDRYESFTRHSAV
jgi:ABC-type polysaccharide/polyol phosphate transport system ATPase subunit